MATAIDRSSPLPFYFQLKQILLDDLRERQPAPGDRLPGDHELCGTFDVSRTVVRQALSELELEGVIQRIKGRGTFVAPERTPERLVQSLTGLSEDVAARGSVLVSDVRRLEVVPADEPVARELQLAVGDEVVVLERLRFVDGEPYVLVTAHLPLDVAPGLVEQDFRQQSLYRLLEEEYGVVVTHGRRAVEASLAQEELAESLQIEVGDPVLVLRSTALAGERPVETFVAYHRGDRSRFEVGLPRNPPAETLPEPLMRVRVPGAAAGT